MVLLTKLAVHYHRPDFTEGQAKSLIRDMVEDLAMFTIGEVDDAIKTYRRDGSNRFFPTSGQLRGPILAGRTEKAAMAKISDRPIPHDSRPIRWWSQSRAMWKPDWRDLDVPDGEFVRDKDTGKWRKAWRLS